MKKINIVLIILVSFSTTISIDSSYGQIKNLETNLEWSDLFQNITAKLE